MSTLALASSDRIAATIQAAVLEWKPWIPNECGDTYTVQESEIIRTQAAVYRLAALLILHRVRFAFGSGDEVARVLSKAILGYTHKIYRHALSVSISQGSTRGGPEPCNPFEYRLGLPFLVASVEAEDAQERKELLDKLPVVICQQMYPNISKMLERFLVFVWNVRDTGCQEIWIDLVRRGPSFVLF
jgi:hypothetical protein